MRAIAKRNKFQWNFLSKKSLNKKAKVTEKILTLYNALNHSQ